MLALYRKYRPKKLDELIGQETIATIIKNAAIANKIGHAYLFYGSRGTGKTSTARLIAKLLNCEKRINDEKFRHIGEPCGTCSHCEEIENGFSIDVIEIDAASNRGIDEIRNLKENISSAPAKGDYKVYIIDEVHMLTGPAFNALLKTLEEPPAHVVFILATTEFEKVPGTIASRSQRFIFKKPAKIKIIEKLNTIIAAEKISIDEDSIDLIASIADGSFRDAESLLDQLNSSNEKITLTKIEQLTGRTGLKKVHELVETILKNNSAQSLEILTRLSEEGTNLTQFTKDLIHYLRKVLSLKTNPNLETHFANELTKEEINQLKNLTTLSSPEQLTKLIKAFIQSYTEIRYSPFALIPLEVAIIENVKLE